MFLFTSGGTFACITKDITVDRAITINNTLTQSTLKCAVVYNSQLNNDIVSLIGETVEMLEDLNTDKSLYGEVSFLNAITIDKAIEALNRFLLSPDNIAVQTIIEYDLKMREYFATYILDDLNDVGIEKHNSLLVRQGLIIKRANEYASNLLIINTPPIKLNLN